VTPAAATACVVGGRVALLAVAIAALAGPLFATWQAAATPWWIHAALVALLLLGWIRPGWAPAVLLLLVPLLPVVPLEAEPLVPLDEVSLPERLPEALPLPERLPLAALPELLAELQRIHAARQA